MFLQYGNITEKITLVWLIIRWRMTWTNGYVIKGVMIETELLKNGSLYFVTCYMTYLLNNNKSHCLKWTLLHHHNVCFILHNKLTFDDFTSRNLKYWNLYTTHYAMLDKYIRLNTIYTYLSDHYGLRNCLIQIVD